MWLRDFLFIMLLFVGINISAGDYGIDLRLNKKNGRYAVGDEIVCSASWMQNGAPVATGAEKLRCVVKREGLVIKTTDFLPDGKLALVRVPATEAGWLYFAFQVLDSNGEAMDNPGTKTPQSKKQLLGEIGAIVAPELIQSSASPPDDLAEYWARCRLELQTLPVEAECEELPSDDAQIRLFAVQVRLPESFATWYMARPANAKPESCFIKIDFLSWSNCDANRQTAIKTAKLGGIGIAATWHGLAVNKEPDFYQRECRKFRALAGCDSRDHWSFRQTYLRVLRSLEWAKALPEWNKKDLVVQGGSLGGAQALAAAALDGDVSIAIVSVPCFCEFAASHDGRQRSIPFKAGEGERLIANTPLVGKAMAYFDLVNLATLVKCEIYLATGLADELCPPSSVAAVYNRLPNATTKALYINPRTGHGGTTPNIDGNRRLQEFFNSVKICPTPKELTP